MKLLRQNDPNFNICRIVCTVLANCPRYQIWNQKNVLQKLQPWSELLGHFPVLLENELCLLLPLPTPKSMLISNH